MSHRRRARRSWICALVAAWSLIDPPLNSLLCAAVVLRLSRTWPARPIPPEVRRRRVSGAGTRARRSRAPLPLTVDLAANVGGVNQVHWTSTRFVRIGFYVRSATPRLTLSAPLDHPPPVLGRPAGGGGRGRGGQPGEAGGGVPPCRQVPGRDAQADGGADAERQLRAAGELEQRGLGHAELGRERALATFETMFRGD
jgi:hypothetical protein